MANRFEAMKPLPLTPEIDAVARRTVTDDELRLAIEKAPPGIFDARSWAYWNLKLGRYPAPPMPERSIPGADPKNAPS